MAHRPDKSRITRLAVKPSGVENIKAYRMPSRNLGTIKKTSGKARYYWGLSRHHSRQDTGIKALTINVAESDDYLQGAKSLINPAFQGVISLWKRQQIGMWKCGKGCGKRHNLPPLLGFL
jgi:hypothetical protein